MKYFLLFIIISIPTSPYAEEQNFEKAIMGCWKLIVQDKEQYLKRGVSEEELENMAIEHCFLKDGVMLMRGKDPKYTENMIKEFTGTYRIESDRLYFSLNFGESGAIENQKIEILNNILNLSPIELNGKISNKFKKIEQWTLKL